MNKILVVGGGAAGMMAAVTAARNGKKVRFKGPRDAQAAGIAAVYQHPTSYPELSVTENIFMGHEIRKFGMIQWNVMN